MALTLVVHSFVADSSLLDCCDLVVFFWVFFSLHLMLACRPQFGFLRWFQLFYFFHLWFGVSCLLAWLRQPLIFRLPPAFVVWSFFATGICVQSLSFTAFSAVGLRVRLFVFAMLALVSRYQCTCQFFFYIMLCGCCSLASSLEIRTGNFSKSVTLWTPYKFRFEAKPIWYSIKFTKSHSANAHYINGRDW